ncbi:hypothetical protein CYMTET_55213 [Cymbomonas tetramitiformis]|uniref:Transmembrane protein n=1 Tax=Cymbomonas tetramitiformis TaxID=36881 RepID=A0AAE0BET5_9CHLO|nr:hypothetical protein CYMTET_55213 [Cymbomonas tetramitiformis]|eukprot:gene84-120_t
MLVAEKKTFASDGKLAQGVDTVHDKINLAILTLFCLIYVAMVIFSVVTSAVESLRYFTVWALICHAINTLIILIFKVTIVASHLCTRAAALNNLSKYSHAFLPSLLILSVTVFVSILVMLAFYSTSVLDAADMSAGDIAEAEMYNVFTHVFPVLSSMWTTYAFYPNTHQEFNARSLRRMSLLSMSCAQKVYVHFLHVYLLLFVYAISFDSTDVYGTPVMGTTLIVFSVGLVASVGVGLCVVYYYAYHPTPTGE